MTTSKPLRTLGVATCALLVFLALAKILVVPIPRRGLQGAGLYTFVDALRFYELFFATLGASWVAARWLGLSRPSGGLLAVGAAFGNVALLIVDVRRHVYSDWIERHIAEGYGSPTAIWSYATGLGCVAIGCWLWAWRLDAGRCE